MLRPPTVRTVNATLVLAAGSRAGLEAPLMVGFYMIGRHADCQIRPKSKSVSRRHCLIHHRGDAVMVFDLRSTSGTSINEDKIDAHQWIELNDGDLLRLGKIGFHLRLDDSNESPAINESSGTLVQEAAWETFDVAGFLDVEDQADQEERYERIRSSHLNREEAEADAGESLNPEETMVEDAEDEEVDDVMSTEISDEEKHGEPEHLEESLGAPQEAAASIAPPTSKPRRRFSMPTFGLGRLKTILDGSDGGFGLERLKLVLLAAVTVAILGYAAFKGYQFVEGPSVRVLQDID